MEPEDLFLRQHAVEIQPDGNLLLFDNGLDVDEAIRFSEPLEKVRTYSRVIELELTFDSSGAPERAEVVWDYTDRNLYAFARSEADRLSNGNTLITYSRLEELDDSLILEVTPEGDVAWQLRTPPGWSTYRSERIHPRYGYVIGAER